MLNVRPIRKCARVRTLISSGLDVDEPTGLEPVLRQS